jgi:hypothetical protein
MKKVVALALVMSAFGALALTCSDAEARPAWKTRVNHRQVRQQTRLYNGTASGALTRREHRNLQQQQAKLAMKEAQFRRSGSGLTKAEAAKLEARQDAYSANIYKQKHDSQSRPE